MYHTLPDGRRLYYEFVATQKSGAPTLVFLNGLSQSTLVWKPFETAFLAHFNVLLLDNLFQGQSDKEGTHRSFVQHAADVESLIQALDIQKVIPVGISYGGAVAQRYAVRYPKKMQALVLLSTFSNKNPHFNFIGFSWKRALDAGGYSLMLDTMLPTVLGSTYFENPLIPIEDLRQMRAGLNENREALLKLMQATEESGDYRPELKNIRVPALVVNGDLDPLTTPAMGEDTHEALPDSRHKVIAGAGHSLNLEAVPQTISLMQSFFQELHLL